MGGAKIPDHLLGLQDAPWPVAALVRRRSHGPQMFAAAQCPGAVLRSDTIDILLTLRIHTEDGRRFAVGADDQVAHLKISDGTPAVRSEDVGEDRLGTAA